MAALNGDGCEPPANLSEIRTWATQTKQTAAHVSDTPAHSTVNAECIVIENFAYTPYDGDGHSWKNLSDSWLGSVVMINSMGHEFEASYVKSERPYHPEGRENYKAKQMTLALGQANKLKASGQCDRVRIVKHQDDDMEGFEETLSQSH
jgi:hypothetical protein